MSTSDNKCASCNSEPDAKQISLKQCSRCKAVKYCSRDSQKKDWKNHKKVCNATIQASASTKSRFVISKPFNALAKGTWLHNRPEEDVYQLLSDVFRLRRYDKFKFEGEVMKGSVYAGGDAASELRNYQDFLNKLTELDTERPQEKKVLPSWWSAEAIEKCVRVGKTDKEAMVERLIEKQDVMDFYKQDDMPMQLRMLGEALDGTLVGGQSGAGMLRMRADHENGTGHPFMTHVSF